MTDAEQFDPIGLLRALEQHRVGFVLVGTLAGVLRGAPETTKVVEICPQLKDENLKRLDHALESLRAAPAGSGAPGAAGLAAEDSRRFATSCGELRVEPAPEGTRGYDDLRRRSTRERIAADGLHVSIASLDDLLRTLRARDLPEEAARVQTYRQLDELTHSFERARGLEL